MALWIYRSLSLEILPDMNLSVILERRKRLALVRLIGTKASGSWTRIIVRRMAISDVSWR
jgi:hypothetical protein